MDRVSWEAARARSYKQFADARVELLAAVRDLDDPFTAEQLKRVGFAQLVTFYRLDNLVLILAHEPPPPGLRDQVKARVRQRLRGLAESIPRPDRSSRPAGRRRWRPA